MKIRKLLLAAAMSTLFITGGVAVKAHEAPCPYCDIDLVQDTPEQDNETVLKVGKKRVEYRCVHCAMKEAPDYKGDLTIVAPSEEKGAPVVLSRQAGKWSSDPEGALFAAQKANHKVCHITYRAFSDKAAFADWVKKHQDNFDKDAKSLNLAEMVKLTQ